MFFKDSIHILREGEVTATQAINGYINDQSLLDSSRPVQVLTTMFSKIHIKGQRASYRPIASICEVVLVDMMRPIITKYSDFTEDERLIIACQIEAAVDNMDWSQMDPFRRMLLRCATEITFSHEVIDNELFHSNISITPNFLN